MNNELEIRDAALADDGKHLRLKLRLSNPADRTVHLYRTLRAIRYDAATKTLEVQLSDRGLEEPTRVGNLVRPRFTSIDPAGETEFELSLPRVISRVKPGQSNVRTPVIESLPAFEAETVDIEVAWSPTPYYRDPRPSGKFRAALVEWTQGYARFRLQRSERAKE